MAVSIRFRREGRKHRAFFRMVAADSRSPRDGKFLEILGYYDPLPTPEVVSCKKDRLIYWLSKGAKPTQSVKSILSRKGIWKEIVDEINTSKKKESAVVSAAQSESESLNE